VRLANLMAKLMFARFVEQAIMNRRRIARGSEVDHEDKRREHQPQRCQAH
jgi:hypothetical protein